MRDRRGSPLLVVLALALGMAAGVLAPRRAAAQFGGPTYCVNCSSEVTQLINKIQLINQYARQGQQLAKQIQQYQDQVVNSLTLPQQVWGNTMASLQQVNTLLSQAQSLAYSMGNLNQQFAQRYKTFGAYAGQPITPAGMTQKYQQWSAEANDNTLFALRAANAQSAQMAGEDTDLRALEQMATSAQGRMQAIQVGNQFAAQSARQIQKLRQLMMLQVQTMANHQQLDQDRIALQQAASAQATVGTRNTAAGGHPF